MKQRLAIWMWKAAIRMEPTIAYLIEHNIRETVALEQQANQQRVAAWRQAVAERAARQ